MDVGSTVDLLTKQIDSAAYVHTLSLLTKKFASHSSSFKVIQNYTDEWGGCSY